MWKPIAGLAFRAVMIAVLAVALYFSLDWPRETSLFPQAVGVPMLALMLISLGMQLLRIRRFGFEPEPAAADAPESVDSAFMVRAAIELAWLVGFGITIWLIGFYPAAFAFLLCYFNRQAKLSAVVSLLWATSAVAVMFVVFYLLLRIQPYHGVVAELLD